MNYFDRSCSGLLAFAMSLTLRELKAGSNVLFSHNGGVI